MVHYTEMEIRKNGEEVDNKLKRKIQVKDQRNK